jgi:hypothetical protein
MEIKKTFWIYLAVLVLLIIAVILTSLNDREPVNTSDLPENLVELTPTPPQEDFFEGVVIPEGFTTYISDLDRLSLSYPDNWVINEPDLAPGSDLLDLWTLYSYEPSTAGVGGVSENGVKVDFEISSADVSTGDSRTLAGCNRENVTCEEIKSNDFSFIRAYDTSGQVPTLTYVTVVESTVFKATASFGLGGDLEERIKTVDEIAGTFEITPNVD